MDIFIIGMLDILLLRMGFECSDELGNRNVLWLDGRLEGLIFFLFLFAFLSMGFMFFVVFNLFF